MGGDVLAVIELFGVPRMRAGTGKVEVEAATLGQALTALAVACPGLHDTVIRNNRLQPTYKANLNGHRFISDPTTPICGGDAIIILAADAGG